MTDIHYVGDSRLLLTRQVLDIQKSLGYPTHLIEEETLGEHIQRVATAFVEGGMPHPGRSLIVLASDPTRRIQDAERRKIVLPKWSVRVHKLVVIRKIDNPAMMGIYRGKELVALRETLIRLHAITLAERLNQERTRTPLRRSGWKSGHSARRRREREEGSCSKL